MTAAIISVHAPKAGGTTFLELLRQAYGEAEVLLDNADDPANPDSGFRLDPHGWDLRRPLALPPGVRAVHGHFHASKYDKVPDAFRLTFLRHPVSNMVSIYCYWRKIPPQPSGLHQYFRQQELDLLQLARLPLLRRLYSETYFGGWDMGRMDFIGRHEAREEGLMAVGARLGLSLDAGLHLNKTASKADPEREALLADTRLMARLTELLDDDIRFYETHAP